MAPPPWRRSRRGQWGDVKVKIVGGALAGLTAGFLVKVEELSADLSRVRLFHTSVTRANATWPTWPGEPGFTGDFAEYRRPEVPHLDGRRLCHPGSRVSSARRPMSNRACIGRPAITRLIKYILNKYQPDLVMVGYPTTDEFQHQFLGLITPTLPNGAPNPAYDDVQVNRHAGWAASPSAHASSSALIRAPMLPWRWSSPDAQQDLRPSSLPTTALRRSSWRSTPAKCWSTWACSPSRRLPTAARRPVRPSARPRPAGPAARCRSI